ncbi:MAG: hypothetical protein Pyrs2KO_22950 [Pyruvatibacter sp.]
MSPSSRPLAFIVASESANRSLSYEHFAEALSFHGIDARLVSSKPEHTDAFLLLHSLVGDAGKGMQLAGRADAARTIPMQFMMDGAEAAVSGGMPAAIVRDGYARWADGRDQKREMPSGLVIPTSLAKSLDLDAAMEMGAVTATDSSIPLPEQIVRTLEALHLRRSS